MISVEGQASRSMEQNPEIDPHNSGQLILTQVQRHFNGEMVIFNKWYWNNWTPIGKKIKLYLNLTPYTKINSG